MGRLSSALRTELQKSNPNVHWLLALALPGGTRRYGTAALAAATAGQYHGRLLELPRYTFSSRDCSLEGVEVRPVLDDHDFALAKIIKGSSGNSVIHSAATVYLASPNVAEASWLTDFTGLVDSYTFPSLRSVAFRLRPNDLPLERNSPKQALTVADWPNMDSSARGQYPPRLYGKFSADSGGAVPTLYIDTVGFRYLVCIGRAKAVDAVYKDEALQSSGYTVTYPTVNGRTYTLIDFTSTQGTSAITCDVQGYEPVGDGSGALIEEPAAALKHYLVNFIFGDAKTLWLADATAPIDTTHFSAVSTFMSARGHKAARRLVNQLKGVDVINEFLASTQTRLFWTGEGKLALRVDDPSTLTVYGDTPWFREKHIAELGIDYPTDRLIDRVIVQYLRDEVHDKYTQTLEVRDPNLTKEAPESLELPWAYSSLL